MKCWYCGKGCKVRKQCLSRSSARNAKQFSKKEVNSNMFPVLGKGIWVQLEMVGNGISALIHTDLESDLISSQFFGKIKRRKLNRYKPDNFRVQTVSKEQITLEMSATFCVGIGDKYFRLMHM